MYYTSHNHGLTETHDTWVECWAAVVQVYPDAYAVDAHGFEVTADEETLGIGSDRILVWSCEADSENDDGVRAVCTITACDE